MAMHKVRLLKDHEHKGEKYPAGKQIEVRTPVRDWLLANHVISADPDPIGSAAQPKKAEGKKPDALADNSKE